jgi:hypothetical protein
VAISRQMWRDGTRERIDSREGSRSADHRTMGWAKGEWPPGHDFVVWVNAGYSLDHHSGSPVSALPLRPRGPQRPQPSRHGQLPLSRLSAAVRGATPAGAGPRGHPRVGPTAPVGAGRPAGHRPRHRPVPLLAPAVRQRVIPSADPVGAGTAPGAGGKKETAELILECDELGSCVGPKHEPWWVGVALDGRTRRVVAVVAATAPRSPPESCGGSRSCTRSGIETFRESSPRLGGS